MKWAAGRLRAFEEEHGRVQAIGIAAFGPIELRPSAANYGRMLKTPKPHWSGASIVDPVRRAFDLPIALATDVEGAAVAEGLIGAAEGADPFVYMTIGTGIGAGVISKGQPFRGLVHPEIGHMAIPRQAGDSFPGGCPFHGDCLEGMASGPALAGRWGRRAEELTGAVREKAMALEAAYIATGLRTIIFSFAPEKIVIGGGVGLTPGLLPRIRNALEASLGSYPGIGDFTRPDFLKTARLGEMAGPRGALALAQRARNHL